jgi:hypothetical protein
MNFNSLIFIEVLKTEKTSFIPYNHLKFKPIMKLNSFKALSFTLITSVLLWACGGGSGNTEETSDAGAEFDEAKSQVIGQINQSKG